MDTPFPAVDDATFREAVASGTTLVDVWAPWCGACRTLGATLQQLAPALDPALKVVQLDSEANPATAAAFGVMALPTLLLFRDGALVGRRVGALGRQGILAFVAGD